MKHFAWKSLGGWLAGLLVLAAAEGLRAELPTGRYEVVFPGASPVWDVTGTYQVEDAVLSMTFQLTQDFQGKIRGNGNCVFSTAIEHYTGVLTISGSIKSSGGVPRGSLKIELLGQGTFGGEPITVTSKSDYKFEVDADSKSLQGVWKGQTCTSGPSIRKVCEKQVITREILMPEGMDGSWLTEVTLLTAGSRVAGTGKLTLSTGSTFYYEAAGSYKAAADTAKISLKGKSPTTGTSVSFSSASIVPAAIVDGLITGTKLKGKIGGQKLVAP